MGFLQGRAEKTMLFVFSLIPVLWVTGEWNKIDATVVALLGVAVMLITGVISWEDGLKEKGALGRAHLVRGWKVLGLW